MHFDIDGLDVRHVEGKPKYGSKYQASRILGKSMQEVHGGVSQVLCKNCPHNEERRTAKCFSRTYSQISRSAEQVYENQQQRPNDDGDHNHHFHTSSIKYYRAIATCKCKSTISHSVTESS